MKSRLYFILFLASIIGLFIIQNVAMVEIQFLFWSSQMPRSLMMIILLILGIFIGWLLHSYVRSHKKK